MLALLARYEWALISLVVVFMALAELVAVNRSIRRDRERAISPPNPSDGPPPPGA